MKFFKFCIVDILTEGFPFSFLGLEDGNYHKCREVEAWELQWSQLTLDWRYRVGR